MTRSKVDVIQERLVVWGGVETDHVGRTSARKVITMSAVRKMIKHPGTDKRLSRVFVKGKGWFGWNTAYHVYNSVTNYAQLQEGEVGLIKFNLSDSTNQKGDNKCQQKN